MNKSNGESFAKSSYGSINLKPYQIDAINFAVECLLKQVVPIIESPTGSGKTIISIISSIIYAKKTDSTDDKGNREIP